MPVIQEQERGIFGVGRVYATDSTGQRFVYATMNEVALDIKTDLKEYYSENVFPVGVANGHSSIDLSVKHFKLALKPLANDFGLAAPTASTYATQVDETQTIASSTPYIATLSKGATLVAQSEYVQIQKTSPNGVNYLIPMTRVASGSEVAGVSYSITIAGVLTFASADANSPILVTYDYTSTAGSQITMANVAQNTGGIYQVQLVKRDKSPIDGSTGLFIAKFNAVRAGGFKAPFKEGDWNNFERMLKAFADPAGNVATFQFVNV